MHRTNRPAGAGVVTRAVARFAVALSLAGCLLAGVQLASPGTAATGAEPSHPDTGFSEPYAGLTKYEYLAPLELDNSSQLNAPIGQTEADRIAKGLGLTHAFTEKQYAEFIVGKGKDGSPSAAKLFDASVAILTNTVGRPLVAIINGKSTPTVLASYGLYVTAQGALWSPGHKGAPTREVNAFLVPDGYMATWCKENHARAALDSLNHSAYPEEVKYGNESQGGAGNAQLVPNDKGGVNTTVGMSMAPSIWLVNFALIYTLNPKLAADMPARWAPDPATVVDALNDPSSGGVVQYVDYQSYFQ